MSDIELGKSDLRMNTVRRIAAALKCTISELMPDCPDKHASKVIENGPEMTQHDVFHHVVSLGINLTISKQVDYLRLHNLVTIAKTSGAVITLSLKNLDEGDVKKLCVIAPKNIAFIS